MGKKPHTMITSELVRAPEPLREAEPWVLTGLDRVNLILVMGALLVPAHSACIKDDPSCQMMAMDCFCPTAGQYTDYCQSLDEVHRCDPAPLPPCYYGSNCDQYDETCTGTCIEVEPYYEPQCSFEGLHFDGPGGIVVGTTQGSPTSPERPLVLHSGDHGRTWAMSIRESLPAGCRSQRVEEVLFRDPSSGWLRVSGEGTGAGGTGCDAGLYRTTDGGASWTFGAFPSWDGTPIGGGPLYNSLLAPDWLLSGGARAALSRDGGESWIPLGLPPPPSTGDASAVSEVIGFALPDGPDPHGCILYGPDRQVRCGQLDGSGWDQAVDTGGLPVLALADDGHHPGHALIVAGDASATRLLYSVSSGWSFAESQASTYAPPADRAQMSFRTAQRAYLLLWKDGAVRSLMRYQLSGSSLVWTYGREDVSIQPVHTLFVHTLGRLWSVDVDPDGTLSLLYTPSHLFGGHLAEAPSLPTSVTLAGIHLGLGSPAPASPWEP